jgi:hypothetical protein
MDDKKKEILRTAEHALHYTELRDSRDAMHRVSTFTTYIKAKTDDKINSALLIMYGVLLMPYCVPISYM